MGRHDCIYTCASRFSKGDKLHRLKPLTVSLDLCEPHVCVNIGIAVTREMFRRYQHTIR